MNIKAIAIRFCTLGSLLLMGCVVPEAEQFTVSQKAYFKSKIEQKLGAGSVAGMSHTIVTGRNITIGLSPGHGEKDCIKALQAISRDPSMPAADNVCVKVDRIRETTTGSIIMDLEIDKKHGNRTYVSMPSQDVQRSTICSYTLTRAGLLKGESPQQVVRNGFYISGPYKGQATDWYSAAFP